jgi:hypothetical protein
VDAGDLVVGVVRVAEGERQIERLPYAGEGVITPLTARMEHSEADQQRLVGAFVSRRLEPLLCDIELSEHQPVVSGFSRTVCDVLGGRSARRPRGSESSSTPLDSLTPAATPRV